MKIKYIFPFTLTVLLAFYLAGCNSAVYDDLSGCPQGVNFEFYRQTLCEQSPHYPSDIRQVRVFAFDERERLVDEFSEEGIALSSDYRYSVLFKHTGKFTFVAWGGADLSNYNFSDFKKGITSKGDMFASLVRQDGVPSVPAPLYIGSFSGLVIEKREDSGSIYDQVSFNMRELTNWVHFAFHGLPPGREFRVVVTNDNGKYDFNGGILPDSHFNHISIPWREEDVLKADFFLMKLEEGCGTRISVIDVKTGDAVYNTDLVDDLIMYKGDSGVPPYNLECDHDFDIDVTLEWRDETWMLVKATVNGWNVVTRPVILEE